MNEQHLIDSGLYIRNEAGELELTQKGRQLLDDAKRDQEEQARVGAITVYIDAALKAAGIDADIEIYKQRVTIHIGYFVVMGTIGSDFEIEQGYERANIWHNDTSELIEELHMLQKAYDIMKALDLSAWAVEEVNPYPRMSIPIWGDLSQWTLPPLRVEDIWQEDDE